MCNDFIMNDIINGDIWIGMNEFYSFESLCVCSTSKIYNSEGLNQTRSIDISGIELAQNMSVLRSTLDIN